jgi:hypothetical protein
MELIDLLCGCSSLEATSGLQAIAGRRGRHFKDQDAVAGCDEIQRVVAMANHGRQRCITGSRPRPRRVQWVSCRRRGQMVSLGEHMRPVGIHQMRRWGHGWGSCFLLQRKTLALHSARPKDWTDTARLEGWVRKSPAALGRCCQLGVRNVSRSSPVPGPPVRAASSRAGPCAIRMQSCAAPARWGSILTPSSLSVSAPGA